MSRVPCYPLISLSPGGFGVARPGGRAASLSANAILSGSSSLMSTNSVPECASPVLLGSAQCCLPP